MLCFSWQIAFFLCVLCDFFAHFAVKSFNAEIAEKRRGPQSFSKSIYPLHSSHILPVKRLNMSIEMIFFGFRCRRRGSPLVLPLIRMKPLSVPSRLCTIFHFLRFKKFKLREPKAAQKSAVNSQNQIFVSHSDDIIPVKNCASKH